MGSDNAFDRVVREIGGAEFVDQLAALNGSDFTTVMLEVVKRQGFGLLDPALARHMATTAAASPRTEVCLTVTSPEGYATDVERVLWAQEIPSEVRVSGHVYDVKTGLLSTVDAKSKK
jgi:hypothetical protein